MYFWRCRYTRTYANKMTFATVKVRIYSRQHIYIIHKDKYYKIQVMNLKRKCYFAYIIGNFHI